MKITAKVFKRESAGAPTIKGIASITIEDSIVISEIKIIEGKNGLFIAMPNRKLPNGEYKDIAFPITKKVREQIIDVILKEYNGEQQNQELTDGLDLPF